MIGNATEYLLGTEFNVGSYATIFTGGNATYGDSDRVAVAALNTSLGLGLTAAELRAIPSRPTVVNSRQWGFMWHADGNNLAITGGTVVNSPHATFLNKGRRSSVTVDGSKGARLNPADGVIVQVIDNDDPGPVMVDGVLENAGVYTQPTGEPTKDSSFDVTVVHVHRLGVRLRQLPAGRQLLQRPARWPRIRRRRPGRRSRHRPEPGAELRGQHGRRHRHLDAGHAPADTIDSANWWQLGHVSNTPQPAINNGVIVSLADRSTWTVTGTSYLTALSLDATSSVAAPGGGHVTMTVDGTPTAITPGASYTGAIVVTVTCGSPLTGAGRGPRIAARNR